jgi:hypothetical protein
VTTAELEKGDIEKIAVVCAGAAFTESGAASLRTAFCNTGGQCGEIRLEAAACALMVIIGLGPACRPRR